MKFPILKLKKNECRRLRAGHLWVFSNEVDTKATPLSDFKPGETVTVSSANGDTIGNAYINPHSLICARLFSRNPRQQLDGEFFEKAIHTSLELRQAYFSKPYYRLVYGESDFLPGLIVDRFNETLVMQTSTLGMDLSQQTIIDSLNAVINPDNIILKNDIASRKMEGLESVVEVAKGEVSDLLSVEENQCQFCFSALHGQKTGWFYDHRANRQSMQRWVTDKRVLDVFSYVGSWGIQAAVAGASEVHCIETSSAACETIESNAQLNKVSEKMNIIQEDAFEALSSLKNAGKQYDVIILDPPAFIKRKKDVKNGTTAYQRLNRLAMQLLAHNGILISASCSFHFSRADHLRVLRNTAYKHGFRIQIVGENQYAPDHPVHPAIPETDYLSCFTLRILKH